MKTEREQLELAAQAAGYIIDEHTEDGAWVHIKGAELNGDGEPPIFLWRPRVDDGDALRLAVKLGMAINHDDAAAVRVGWFANQQCPITMDCTGPWFWKEWLRDSGDDPNAATRLAIVRAAAAIGEAL